MQKERTLRGLEAILEKQKIFSRKISPVLKEKRINDAGNPEITYLLPMIGKRVKFAEDGTLTEAAIKVIVTIEGHQVVVH